MSYSAFELSEELGSPIELYEFKVGDGLTEVYRFTSADVNVEFIGNIYSATPIDRNQITLDPSQSLQINADKNNSIAQKMQRFPDGILITLTLRRIHAGDLQPIISWRGRVKSASFDGGRATITCDPKNKSLKKSALRASYGFNCDKILYSASCGANKNNFKYRAYVQAFYDNFSSVGDGTNYSFVVATALTDPLPAGQYEPVFIGGYMRRVSNGDVRMITSVINLPFSSPGFCLLAPFDNLQLNEQLEVFYGCAHDFNTCRTKFNNVENFRGFPFIPTKNPFDTNIN